MVSPLYHSFEFAVLFYCFKVGFHCSLLCDATLCLVQASFAMSVIDKYSFVFMLIIASSVSQWT